MNREILSINQLQKKRARKKKVRIVWALVIGLVIINYTANHFFKKPQPKAQQTEILSASQSIKESPNPASTEVPLMVSNSLKEAVENSLSGTKGTYGISIKNIKTGESYYSNEHRVYEAGSLYKLWIMATTYKQVQQGILTEDQVLSEKVATLNRKFDIDPDLAEMSSGGISLSVKQALTQMITISHNYAALLLTEKLKLSTVASFLKDNGFSESIVGTDGAAPTTTSSDIAKFLEKLYKGELANKETTEKMLTLLKNQKLNDKLPKYLPDDTIIAHKTGELDYFSHDAGIVYAPSGDYLIVILSESKSPPGAEDRIALLSKAVYEYFSKKNT